MLGRVAIFIFCLFCFVGLQSAADAGGLPGIDPLGVAGASQTLSDSLDRTMNQLDALEDKADGHVKERLEQIRSIMQEALKGGNAAIKHAEDAMLEVEKQVDKDAINLIYAEKCATETMMNDQAQRAFASFVASLKKTDPSFYFLGIKIFDLKVNDVQIIDPDKAYISAKMAALTLLDRTQKDDFPAYNILSTYMKLEHAARYTQCYYINDVSNVKWTQEINSLEVAMQPWIELNPKMIQ